MTDLIILPNASNGNNNTPSEIVWNSSATGVLYFDDGVSYAKNVTKTEISYSYLGFDDPPIKGSNCSVV